MSHAAVDSFTTFGEFLRYLRRQARLTQRELGMAVGYSEAQINRLESGQRLPDVLAVKTQFVEALGLQREPALAGRLVELAATIRGQAFAQVEAAQGQLNERAVAYALQGSQAEAA